MDDWYLFEHIRKSSSRDAQAILQHKHDRRVRETPEVAKAVDLQAHEQAIKELQSQGLDAWAVDASKSWYKSGTSEISIAADSSRGKFARGRPLTQVSETAGRIRDSQQRRIYVPLEQKTRAEGMLTPKGDSHGPS